MSRTWSAWSRVTVPQNFVNGLADYDKTIQLTPPSSPSRALLRRHVRRGHYQFWPLHRELHGDSAGHGGSLSFISATAFNVSFYQASGSQAFVIQTTHRANVVGVPASAATPLAHP